MIWYFHDYKGVDFEHRFAVNNSVPYFWCEHDLSRDDAPLGDILLLSVSRGWLKYRWLRLKNKFNKKSFADYKHFRELWTSTKDFGSV